MIEDLGRGPGGGSEGGGVGDGRTRVLEDRPKDRGLGVGAQRRENPPGRSPRERDPLSDRQFGKPGFEEALGIAPEHGTDADVPRKFGEFDPREVREKPPREREGGGRVADEEDLDLAPDRQAGLGGDPPENRRGSRSVAEEVENLLGPPRPLRRSVPRHPVGI